MRYPRHVLHELDIVPICHPAFCPASAMTMFRPKICSEVDEAALLRPPLSNSSGTASKQLANMAEFNALELEMPSDFVAAPDATLPFGAALRADCGQKSTVSLR